eukprot:1794815-Rhodomonas_salina.3
MKKEGGGRERGRKRKGEGEGEGEGKREGEGEGEGRREAPREREREEGMEREQGREREPDVSGTALSCTAILPSNSTDPFRARDTFFQKDARDLEGGGGFNLEDNGSNDFGGGGCGVNVRPGTRIA